MSNATPYIHPSPASSLASETRSITISSSTLDALNSFLDELLYSFVCSFPQTGDRSSASVRLPLATLNFKEAVLAVFAKTLGNQSLARDAILEAELEAREWIKHRGSKSDPAAITPVSPSISRRPSQNALETIHDGVSSNSQPPRVATLGAVYRELQSSTNALSSLGVRAAFHNTPASRAAAAVALSSTKQLKHTSPLFVVYASSVINYIAAYLVKGCGRIVERDPSSSVANLQALVELMGEDPLLAELWNGMNIKLSVERDVAQSTISNRRQGKFEGPKSDASRPTTAQSTSTSTSSGSQNNNNNNNSGNNYSGGIVSTLLTPVRKASLRTKRSLPARGISSSDGIIVQPRPSTFTTSTNDTSTSLQANASSNPRSALQVSSIPFKAPLSPAQAYQQSVRSRGKNIDVANSDTALPKDTRAFLDYADESQQQQPSNAADAEAAFLSTASNNPSSSSFSTSRNNSTRNKRSASSSSSPSFTTVGGLPATAPPALPRRTSSGNSEDQDEFESLLQGRETRKMSLTPSRFRNTANGAGAVESGESASYGSPSLPSAYSTAPQRIGRLHARSARPSRQAPIDEQSNEESLEDDDDLFGLQPKRKGGKKESLMDLLNSEPPWAATSGSSQSGGAGGAGLSKAERMMGLSAATASGGGGGALPASVMRSATAPSGPKKFSSIANLDFLASSTLNTQGRPSLSDTLTIRPTTANTVSTFDGYNDFLSSKTSLGGTETGGALNDFPIPPQPRLQTHKSSPNLSSSSAPFAGSSFSSNGGGAAASSAHASLSPAAMRRKMVAKDERAVRVERNDDLLDFLKNAPPPPPPSAFPTNEPTTPTSTVSSRSRSGSSKFRNFLSSSSSKKSCMVPSQPETVYSEPASTFDSAAPATVFRMPRSRQSSSKDNELDDFGRLPRKLSKNFKGPHTAKADAEIAEMDKEIARKQEKEEEESLQQYKGIYAALNVDGTNHARSGYSSLAAARQLPNLPPALSASRPHQPAVAPLMTPDNSREDLYGIANNTRAMNSGQVAANVPTPLETPPTTPQEKRAAFVPVLAIHEETPASAMVRQHRRMSSLIKRKPSPRLEDEDLDALNASTRPAGERKDSVVSVLSTRDSVKRDRQASAGSSSYHSLRAREASTNSFISVSSGSGTQPAPSAVQEIVQEMIVPEAIQKEEMEIIPTPLYSAHESIRSARAQVERPCSVAGNSRPAYTIHMPLSPAPKNGKPDLHDILLGLRNNMLLASSVNDCLEMLDAAMFEVAYDVTSGASTIYEEVEEDQEKGFRTLRHRTSATQNRAYNAIIEYILEPGEISYPKGFHRFESTVMCPMNSPSSGPLSPTMEKTPSLDYSAESNESESEAEREKDNTTYAGHGKDSMDTGDEQEVLYS